MRSSRGAPCQLAVPLNENGLDRIGLELAVEAIELRELGALGTLQRHHAVLDADGLQRDIRWDEGKRTGRDRERAPVAAAVGIDGEAQHRPLKLDLVGFQNALQERRHRQLHGEAVGAEKRLARRRRRIGDAQLVEAHVGSRQQAYVDVAADAHLAAKDAGRLLLEHAAITVPIDEIRHREQRGERKRKQAGDV